MSELVIIHQNINQKFYKIVDKVEIETRNTPESVAKNLLEVAKEKSANVIVLTEFNVLDNYKEALEKPLTDAGYVIFKNEEIKNLDQGKVKIVSQVLIAIKNDIVTEQESKVIPVGLDQNDEIYSKIRYGLTYYNIGETPNFLRIDIEMNGKPYSIIGVRIRLLHSGGPQERIFRAKQLDILLDSLPKDREMIMIGDFNTSPSDIFRKKGSKWHFDDVYLKSLTEHGLKCDIPVNGSSPFYSKYKLDHLITSNQLKVGMVEYIQKNCFQQMNNENIPDHSILLARITI